MELAGLLLAVLIGLSLGLVGGGGSILTVPVLVYIIGIPPMDATFYSLFIVGMTAMLGAFEYYKKNLINLKAGLAFTLPSIISVFITRRYILTTIPNHILNVGNFELTKNILIMILFAVLMVFASLSMIGQKKTFIRLGKKQEDATFNYSFIFLEGIVVGLFTGILGVGGGFFIIPALVLFGKLPMKMAVGTSLMIIAFNSMVGFATDLVTSTHINWTFLLSFSCFAFAGMLLGTHLSEYIDNNKLKSAFGWLTLFMGAFILTKELIIRMII
ncbi:MAG: sulfite exporter TauE/SafE family protein [Cytophagales bacterium]|nr:sulfite exporter TauE/SafE family protein [Cytophaga sp.]